MRASVKIAFFRLSRQYARWAVLGGSRDGISTSRIFLRSIISQYLHEKISPEQIQKAEQALIDNGIEADEAQTVLQAIGYVLLDTMLYPED